jgi:phage gp36-like protein
VSYASVADLVARFDVRVVGDLAADTGERISSTTLTSNANVQAALDDASGEIDSVILVAKRYTSAELSALTGNSLSYLKRITCEIAMHLLVERRLYLSTEEFGERMFTRYKDRLNELRSGTRIFNIGDADAAGLPTNGGPTTGERERFNYITERSRGHIYPLMRLPQNR